MLKYMLPKKAGLMVFTDKIIFSKNLKIREENAVELEFIWLKYIIYIFPYFLCSIASI